MRHAIAAVSAALLVAAGPASLRAEVLQNEAIDCTGWMMWVPCARNGWGEPISLDGNLHVLWAVTYDGNGGYHGRSHVQPQGVHAHGVWSGDVYQGTGVTQYRVNATAGYVYKYVNNFRMIGRGQAKNLTIHVNYHYVVNGNGEVTSQVDNYNASCD